MCTHEYSCPLGPEEGFGHPGAGITGVGAGTQTQALCKSGMRVLVLSCLSSACVKVVCFFSCCRSHSAQSPSAGITGISHHDQPSVWFYRALARFQAGDTRIIFTWSWRCNLPGHYGKQPQRYLGIPLLPTPLSSRDKMLPWKSCPRTLCDRATYQQVRDPWVDSPALPKVGVVAQACNPSPVGG